MMKNETFKKKPISPVSRALKKCHPDVILRLIIIN